MKTWVKSVDVVDDLNFNFVLTTTNPQFIFNYFTNHDDIGLFIVPKHIFEGQDLHNFKNFDLARACRSPRARTSCRLERSAENLGSRSQSADARSPASRASPAPKRLIFLPTYDETKMSQMLIANEADISLNISVQRCRRSLPKTRRSSPHFRPEIAVRLHRLVAERLGFNCTTKPWDDPNMRWAISYAIDRDKLVQFGYLGAGVPTQLPYPDYPPLRPFVDAAKDLLAKYPTNEFNLDKSAALLSRRGIRERRRRLLGERWPEVESADHHLFSLRRYHAVPRHHAPERGHRLQLLDADRPSTTMSTRGRLPGYVWGHGGSVRDPYATLELYHSKWFKPTGTAATNFYRWKNADFDAAVDKMSVVAGSDPQMTTLFLQAIEIWLKELPDVPLLQFYHRIPMNQTYWINWPDENNPYINGRLLAPHGPAGSARHQTRRFIARFQRPAKRQDPEASASGSCRFMSTHPCLASLCPFHHPEGASCRSTFSTFTAANLSCSLLPTLRVGLRAVRRLLRQEIIPASGKRTRECPGYRWEEPITGKRPPPVPIRSRCRSDPPTASTGRSR